MSVYHPHWWHKSYTHNTLILCFQSILIWIWKPSECVEVSDCDCSDVLPASDNLIKHTWYEDSKQCRDKMPGYKIMIMHDWTLIYNSIRNAAIGMPSYMYFWQLRLMLDKPVKYTENWQVGNLNSLADSNKELWDNNCYEIIILSHRW